MSIERYYSVTVGLATLQAMQAQLDDARRILKMIAEMPASTHSVDAELCEEWPDGHPAIKLSTLSANLNIERNAKGL